MPTEIELRNISKSFHSGEGELAVLKGIDMNIERGELLSIIGTSGSGKSTLMNILGLLDRPTSGKYLLHNLDVTDLNEDERAELRNQTIGFVFQSFFLLPRLNLIQNIALPLMYRASSEAEANDKAFSMLQKVGLASKNKYFPNRLSGGEQQRIAIARALVGDPIIILADEPTGSLDTVTGQRIMDLFIELNEKDKVTIVIVTHNPKIAEQCHRIIHIQDGKVKQNH